jgi:alkaline phosphatase
MQASRRLILTTLATVFVSANICFGQAPSPTKEADSRSRPSPAEDAEDQHDDFLRDYQFQAVDSGECEWCHWGDRQGKFSNWTTHSNRLVPIYTWGIKLDRFEKSNSCYRDEKKLKEIYGRLPDETLNPKADYFDQTDIFRLQQQAIEEGRKNIIVIIFDGMDWQTTQAAAVYQEGRIAYKRGRGTGLAFLDYRRRSSDYGYFVSSPHNNDSKTDVNAQAVTVQGKRGGGYSAAFGGNRPWSRPADPSYLIGKRKSLPHGYTDSAASATSMFSGIKTYNSSVNVSPDGKQVESIARQLQKQGMAIGVVSSVPISHATPASAYGNNVTRNDYQDLSRDLLGLKSVSHPKKPLPGVDVLIGCGITETKDDDRTKQGNNFVPGNKYLTAKNLKAIDVQNGGRYQVAQRTEGQVGRRALLNAAQRAADNGERLFGFYGQGGHLPYRTADGKYDPTRGVSRAERYTSGDLIENPTLADMAEAALTVLEKNKDGFWLMIEAGEVDWANHNNNVDNSIGAVVSGDRAFQKVVQWVEENSDWSETAVILTADHGHLLFVDDLEALAGSRLESKPIQRVNASKAKDNANKPSGA